MPVKTYGKRGKKLTNGEIISHAHNMTWWGSEFIADCGGCDLALITDAHNIKLFSEELVRRIDMKAYGDPQIIHFGTEDKAGYTLVQLIETSNITAHFSNDTCSVFLNVFSCREFDKHVVIEVINKYFQPSMIHHTMNDRLAYVK